MGSVPAKPPGPLALAVIVAVLSLGFVSTGAASAPRASLVRSPHPAPSILDNSGRMDANNLDMAVTNHGSFAFDLLNGDAPGLIFPKGSGHGVIFAAGPWFGARVGGEIRLALGHYGQPEFVPGPMLNGTWQEDDLRFQNYTIVRGNTTDPDYVSWPVPDGAPIDSKGHPALLGDKMIWSVYNDADPSRHRLFAGGTAPMGIEVRQTVFAFNRAGAIGNVIFLKIEVQNKGGNQLDDFHAALWIDPDLGDPNNDLIGCDTTRAMGYCYNDIGADAAYGTTPPAVGVCLLQGPRVSRGSGIVDTLGLSAFSKWHFGLDPNAEFHTDNLFHGLDRYGNPVYDYYFGLPTKFMVTGDPVLGIGWLDNFYDDPRFLLTIGPFPLAPGQSQEMIWAICVGQGSDRLDSIRELRTVQAAARAAYQSRFQLPADPLPPVITATTANIAPAGGGDLKTPGSDLRLYFPPGAFTKEAVVTVKSTASIPGALASGAAPAGTGWDIGWAGGSLPGSYDQPWSGGSLEKSAALKILCPVSPPLGASERFAVYDSTGPSGWQRLGGTMSNGEVAVPMREPGRYALFRESTRVDVSSLLDLADASMGSVGPTIRDVRFSPRVFSPTGSFASPEVNISFTLARPAPVTVRVYSRSGRLIREIASGQSMNEGANLIAWDARDRDGKIASDGLYMVTVEALGYTERKNLAVVR